MPEEVPKNMKYKIWTIWEKSDNDIYFSKIAEREIKKAAKSMNLSQEDVDNLARTSLLGIPALQKCVESFKKGRRPVFPQLPPSYQKLHLHLPNGRIIRGDKTVICAGVTAENKPIFNRNLRF